MTIQSFTTRLIARYVTCAVSMREYHLSGASTARGLGFTITDVAVFMRVTLYVTKALPGSAFGLAPCSTFRLALLIVRMLIGNLRGVQVLLLTHCHQLLFHLPVVRGIRLLPHLRRERSARRRQERCALEIRRGRTKGRDLAVPHLLPLRVLHLRERGRSTNALRHSVRIRFTRTNSMPCSAIVSTEVGPIIHRQTTIGCLRFEREVRPEVHDDPPLCYACCVTVW